MNFLTTKNFGRKSVYVCFQDRYYNYLQKNVKQVFLQRISAESVSACSSSVQNCFPKMAIESNNSQGLCENFILFIFYFVK